MSNLSISINVTVKNFVSEFRYPDFFPPNETWTLSFDSCTKCPVINNGLNKLCLSLVIKKYTLSTKPGTKLGAITINYSFSDAGHLR